MEMMKSRLLSPPLCAVRVCVQLQTILKGNKRPLCVVVVLYHQYHVCAKQLSSLGIRQKISWLGNGMKNEQAQYNAHIYDSS